MASIAVGGLSTNLLVINNIRDMETDRLAHKRTLAVRLGRRFSIWQYRLLLLWAYAVVVIIAYRLEAIVLNLPLVTLPLAFLLWTGICSASTRQSFNRLLAQTALLLVLYSCCFTVGLCL